jgi:hypothetical protein
MARNITGASGTTPETFIAELRRARLEAGNPSYRSIAYHMMQRPDGTDWYSHATIWRALTGEKLPRWDLVKHILQGLGVDDAQILTTWREIWCQAREIEALRRGEPGAQQAAAAPPAHQAPGESPRRLAALTSPPAAGQPDSHECEECGAVIGDPIRHQAWHWRIERQISRAILRAVDGTGQ